MKLIVGLGNPGQEYDHTRHNSGFQCIDAYAASQGVNTEFTSNKKLHCESIKIADTLLIKPTTYMNESGKAVSAIMEYYKIDMNDLCVVHDDVDIDVGAIKIQLGGTSAGHNGIKSIIESLGSNSFTRIRIGVGKPPKEYGIDTADYVLGKFNAEEEKQIAHSIQKACEALTMLKTHDLVATMNKYN
jgi:peptidyl-tRNA hydrolase, PTH1 family